MTTLAIILLGLIQYYICWMTYINWFTHEITYCKMKDSNSIYAMGLLLPLFICIPALPILMVCYVTDIKYLTIRWMFK